MSKKTAIGLLIALIVGHMVLAANYASVTPYRQAGTMFGEIDPKTGQRQKVKDVGAPDERQHVNYVMHLLAGKGFPIFVPGDPNLYESYQSHQPPAFYLLAAGWCTLTGATDLETHDAGMHLRMLNVLIGGGVVAGVYFLAFWGFKREDVALGAASVAAFLPMFSALAGAVSNDPMLILLCTWILALAVKSMNDGWTWKISILIGILSGIAFLTKTTALALAPVLLVAALLPGKLPQEGKAQPRSSASSRLVMVFAAAVIALAMVGPWWARNQRLYQDPLAIKAFGQAFNGSATKVKVVDQITMENPGGRSELTYWTDYVGWWTARSFFGVFGYMDIWLNERGTSFTGVSKRGPAPNALYRVLLAGTALCFIGWLMSLGKKEWRLSLPVQFLNALFAFVVLALFLKFNTEYFQAQARYLLPALGPIACGFSVGIHQLMSKFKGFAMPLLAFIFFTLNVYAVFQLPDAFAQRTGSPPVIQ